MDHNRKWNGVASAHSDWHTTTRSDVFYYVLRVVCYVVLLCLVLKRIFKDVCHSAVPPFSTTVGRHTGDARVPPRGPGERHRGDPCDLPGRRALAGPPVRTSRRPGGLGGIGELDLGNNGKKQRKEAKKDIKKGRKDQGSLLKSCVCVSLMFLEQFRHVQTASEQP